MLQYMISFIYFLDLKEDLEGKNSELKKLILLKSEYEIKL